VVREALEYGIGGFESLFVLFGFVVLDYLAEGVLVLFGEGAVLACLGVVAAHCVFWFCRFG